jgi:hypothetical protein
VTEHPIYKTIEELDYQCKGIILRALNDPLYDANHKFENAKELWETLQIEYGLDDTEVNKFNTSTFLRFTMVDDKPMNEQLHEYQQILMKIQKNKNK